MREQPTLRLPGPRVMLMLILVSLGSWLFAGTQRPTDRSVQLQNRLGYGPSPIDTAFIAQYGEQAWIDANLNPGSDPEPARLVALRNTLTLPTYNVQNSANNQLIQNANLQVVQALYSRNQLVEQLTNFWEQHFSTNFSTVRTNFRPLLDGDLTQASQVAAYFDWLENRDFREGSLGKLKDLLYLSATGPAMMVYLDTVRSTAANPNENYGRELLELYTVGVANHTQADVLAAAKVFTGLEIEQIHPDDYGDPFGRLISEADARALGDVDYNSNVEEADRDLIKEAISNGIYDPDLDVNGDGVLDGQDQKTVTTNLGTVSYVFGLWYDPDDYVPGPKTFFANTPHQLTLGFHVGRPTPEMKFGETVELLNRLASLPMTAEFVSAKLIQKFARLIDPDDLSNITPEMRDLLDRCMAIWAATDGDIRAVLTEIFADPLFLPGHRWAKTETAFESAISTIRAFESPDETVAALTGIGQVNSLRFWIEKEMFHPIFTVGPPTGLPEESPPGSGNLLGRMKRNEVDFVGMPPYPVFDWDAVLTPQDPSSSERLALDMLSLLYGPRGTRSQLVSLAYDYLDDLIAADPGITHAEMCEGLAALVTSYPRGFLQ